MFGKFTWSPFFNSLDSVLCLENRIPQVIYACSKYTLTFHTNTTFLERENERRIEKNGKAHFHFFRSTVLISLRPPDFLSGLCAWAWEAFLHGISCWLFSALAAFYSCFAFGNYSVSCAMVPYTCSRWICYIFCSWGLEQYYVHICYLAPSPVSRRKTLEQIWCYKKRPFFEVPITRKIIYGDRW